MKDKPNEKTYLKRKEIFSPQANVIWKIDKYLEKKEHGHENRLEHE